MSISYKKSGIDYNLLDPLKILAQKQGLLTAKNLKNTSFIEVSKSRGESAYVIEGTDCYYAMVEEGLGTKNLVADKMMKITGKTYYDVIAHDSVAMIVNDLITVGARPVTILAYWAVGESDWMKDKIRVKDLVTGWKKACDLSEASWGGGETPTLKDIVYSNTIELAGSAFGIVEPKSRLILGNKITAEDAIILFESSGIHANGLTLARKLADDLPKGFATILPNKRMYGEELLKPTIIYCKFVNDLLKERIDIHYCVNITGHGWRKLMRAKKKFSYVIDTVPPVPDIFTFIQEKSKLSNREMYATFNMGAGFAIFVPKKNVDKIIDISAKHQIKAYKAGVVKEGKKQVLIEPLQIIFKKDDLNIR